MDAFEAVADPLRRALLTQLAQGPTRVVDLAAAHAVTRPAVSRHLRVLAEAGLVTAEDRGRERHYALRPEGLATVTAYLTSLTTRIPLSDNALDALDTEVRRTTSQRRRARADVRPHEESA